MGSIWTVRRSATDARVAGLCGGLAEHWGVDPVLVRVGAALLALSGGVGVVLYVAGWLLVPVAGQSRSPVQDLLGDSAERWSKEVWIALVTLACVAVLAVFGDILPFGVGPALVVAAIWYLGSTRHRRQRAAVGRAGSPPASTLPPFPDHPGAPTPFTTAAQAWRQRIEEQVLLGSGTATTPPVTAPEPSSPSADRDTDLDAEQAARAAFWAEPDPVGLYGEAPTSGVAPGQSVRRGSLRPARRLRLATVLALGLVCAGLALAHAQGFRVPPVAYAAAALLLVGLALVAATWLGRARGLLALGLLLVPALGLTAAVGAHESMTSWGRTSVRYLSTAELPRQGDSQPRGELVVDLRELRLDGDARYAAHVGTGRMEVLVPRDTPVVLRYTVRQGVALTYAEELRAGADLVGATDPPAPNRGGPTLTLDLTVDRGQLEVRR